MFRVAIITFFVCNCFSFFSQLTYSRNFEARKKNVPLTIINNHANYFFLMRYNKAAHDITIERRAKPGAEIISFTPLKLDSVNANWFDYEKLDYLVFEHDYHIYFLFEKYLNAKKTIYLKIVDTLGKSTGFIELASIEKEKGVTDINFEFKRTVNDNILIIGSQTYGNFAAKKAAVLFDVQKRKVAWAKKLPVENDNTGYSIAFESNETNDLFYVMLKAHVASYKRKYMNHAQMMVPVLFFDSLTLVGYLNGAPALLKTPLAINNLSGLNSIRLSPVRQEVSIIAHFSKQDNNGVNSYFLNQKFAADLSREVYSTVTPLDDSLKERLTFFDGSDYKEASEKEYKHFLKFEQENFEYQISERVEEYYFKELLVWKNDMVTGKQLYQKIIPRKIYSFQGRTRFKNIAKAIPFMYKNKLNILVLESSQNQKKDPNDFRYHRFKKETNLWRSNLMLYKLSDNGLLEKKLIFQNSNFDAVPMNYQSNNQEELILYLNGSKIEKFATLKLDQL